MDAMSPSADDGQPDELERLRARAYGPDADIAGDAAALARLEQLESEQLESGHRAPVAVLGRAGAVSASIPESRSASQAMRGPDPLPAAAPPPAGEPRAPDAAVAAAAPADEPPDPADEPPAPARPWWRRRRWLVLAGGVTAAAVAVAGYSWVAPRAPDHVLHLVSSQPSEPPLRSMGGYLDGLGIDGEVLQYEDFRGFSVWSGTSRYGTECVVVTHLQQGGTGGCATDGLVPTVDLTRVDGWGGDLFADMPIGSMVRLQLEGDHVNVYLSTATEIRR
ncbi:MAG TPA: hypothetical protein VFY91_01325 [Microbacterium sp.]|nr:hypothetical protein [Microbacterium sp.]